MSMLSPTNLERPIISPVHPSSNTSSNGPTNSSPSHPGHHISQSISPTMNRSTPHKSHMQHPSVNQQMDQSIKKLPKCNLRLVFVICTIANVAVASLVLWGIGYQSQLSIVSSLSRSLRQQTVNHALDSVTQMLSYPLMALNELDSNSELGTNYATLDRLNVKKPTATKDVSVIQSIQSVDESSYQSITNQSISQWSFAVDGDVNAAADCVPADALIHEFDFSTDPTFFSVTANTISHFPGLTGALTMSASGTFLGAVLNMSRDPPPLLFYEQDLATDWKLFSFSLPDFNQTLKYNDLFAGLSSSRSAANFFREITQDQLEGGRKTANQTGRAYYSPSSTPWYTKCYDSAMRQINQRPNETITNLNASWVISSQISRTVLSDTLAIQVCKPHINWNPNVTRQFEMAERARQLGSPQANSLLDRAQRVKNAADQNYSLPILDFVTVVTWNPGAMKDFLLTRLNSYVTQDGAAFLITSTDYMIASTLPTDDLALLVNLTDLFDPTSKESLKRRINYTSSRPGQYPYIVALNEDMGELRKLVNVTNVALNKSVEVETAYEWTRNVQGCSHYVQMNILQTPGEFAWVLVMYSPVSAYEGPLQENLMISGVVSGVVLVCSILVTIILTRLIHQPVMTLVSAMQHVVDTHKHSASKLLQSINQQQLHAMDAKQAVKPVVPQSWWKRTLAGVGFVKTVSHQHTDQSIGQTEMVASNKQALNPTATKSNTQSPNFTWLKIDPNLGATTNYQPTNQSSFQAANNQMFSPPENAHSIPTSPFFNDNALKPRAVSGYVFNGSETSNQSVNQNNNSPDQSKQYSNMPRQPSTGTLLSEYDLKRSSTASIFESNNHSRSPFDRLTTASIVSTTNQSISQPFTSPVIDTPASLNRRIQSDPPIKHSTNLNKQVTISEGPSVAVYAPTINQSIHQPTNSTMTRAHSVPHSHSIHINSPGSPPQSSQPSNQSFKPTTVRHEPSINQSINQSRENSQSDDHDLSSYELDRLLRKWQRTMASQGVRPPDEWEADAEMRAQWEAERAKKERRRKQMKEQERQKAIILAGLNNPAAGEQTNNPVTSQQACKRAAEVEMIARAMAADDHSIFVADEQSSVCCWPCDKVNAALAKRSITQSLNESRSSRSHSSDSSSHTGSSQSNSSSSCLPAFCNMTDRQWFGWIGSLSEIVQLEMTFGWLLFKLRNSQVKLEKANEAKQLFLRFVFHEVRIPLNALSLSAHQLEDLIVQEQANNNSNNSPQSTEHEDDISSLQLVGIIKDQVATVARILNDVLSFSRLEDNELHLEFDEFSVPTMLSNLLHSFHSEFKAKNLTVNVEFLEPSPEIQQTEQTNHVNQTSGATSGSDDQSNGPNNISDDSNSQATTTVEWKVIADQYRLRQVLSNFISNACKFSDNGSQIRILTRLTPLPGTFPGEVPPGEINDSGEEAEDSDADEEDADSDPSVTSFACYGWLEFSVHDYGIGIPPDSLKTLFQAYRQIRPGALQEGKGSGLGLSISKKLVELHGGSIQATSEAGRGSVFSFSVPVRITQMFNQINQTDQSNELPNEQPINQSNDQPNDASTNIFSHESKDIADTQSPDLPTRSTTSNIPQTTTTTTPSMGQSTLSSMITGLEASPSMPFPRSLHHTQDLDQSGPMPSRKLSAVSASNSNHQSISQSISESSLVSTSQPIASSDTSSPLRVIVIEDSAVNRKLLCMMLRTMKLNVDSAEDGQVGFDKIVSQLNAVEHSISRLPFEPYDCMFVDDHMPHMTGVELTGKLREMGIQCPIFGVTGNALLSDQARFRAAGVTKVLTKPVSKAAIAQAVQQAKEWKSEREIAQSRLDQLMD